MFAAASTRRFRLLDSHTHRTKTGCRSSASVIQQQTPAKRSSMIQPRATQRTTGRCNCCSNLRDILIEVLTLQESSPTRYVHSRKLHREPNGDAIQGRYSLRGRMDGASGGGKGISDGSFTSRIEVHLPRSHRLHHGTDSRDGEGGNSSINEGGDAPCIKRRRWTDREKQRLRSYKAGGKPDTWVARKFKRSESAVMQQWRKMT